MLSIYSAESQRDSHEEKEEHKMENTDTTAIQGLWTETSENFTVSNSLSALTGMTGIIAVSIVVGLIWVLAKRITGRVSKGKGGA